MVNLRDERLQFQTLCGSSSREALFAVPSFTPWICCSVSMAFFLYIVFESVAGQSAATNAEEDEGVKGLSKLAQIITVISWCACPVACLSPMRRVVSQGRAPRASRGTAYL